MTSFWSRPGFDASVRAVAIIGMLFLLFLWFFGATRYEGFSPAYLALYWIPAAIVFCTCILGVASALKRRHPESDIAWGHAALLALSVGVALFGALATG
jgi:hypothetical protein